MANLILNKTKEVEIISETRLKGMWKVEVVCPNGEVKKPFGDKMRPNLLMRQGLDMLAGVTFTDSGSIAQFIVGAMYGNNTASPTSRTLYTTTNSLPMISNDSQTGFFGWSTFNSTNDCAAQPLTSTGSVIFTKTYDFLAVPNTQTVTEILIIGGSLTTQQRNTTQLSGGNVLSRFILPSPITLSQYQFLRLTYSLQVTIPATVNYENVNVSSGDFNGYGLLRRVGTFNRIFGGMSLAGSPLTYNNVPGAAYRQPWLMMSVNGGTAMLLPGGDANGSSQPTPPVGPNIDFNGNPILATSSSVHTNSVGGEMVDEGYSSDSLSRSKRGKVLFAATNPLVSSYIGGIFITPIGSSTQNFSTTDFQGWYWQFTDLTGQNARGQLKDQNFALVINFRQTSSIT